MSSLIKSWLEKSTKSGRFWFCVQIHICTSRVLLTFNTKNMFFLNLWRRSRLIRLHPTSPDWTEKVISLPDDINVPLRHRLTSQTDLSARWSVSYDSWYSCASSPHHPPHVRRYTQGCDFNFMQICPFNLPPQETLAPFKKRRFSQAMWYWAVFIFIFSVNCVLLCRSRWPTGCENMLVGKAGVADLRSVIHRWRWWSCTWSIKSIKRNKLFLNLLTPRASLLMKTVCFDPI